MNLFIYIFPNARLKPETGSGANVRNGSVIDTKVKNNHRLSPNIATFVNYVF